MFRIIQSLWRFFKLAKRIAVSEGYKQDCREYVKRFNQKNRSKNKALSSWTNVFLKLMHNLLLRFPELDLTTLTREQMIEADLPCLTIARAVSAGLLDRVSDYRSLTHQI